MKEAWKDIPGYEGLYQASTNGKIKSLPRKKWNGHQFITTKERILTPRTDKKGYACYVLYKSGVRKNFKGHYLILNTFLPTFKLLLPLPSIVHPIALQELLIFILLMLLLTDIL